MTAILSELGFRNLVGILFVRVVGHWNGLPREAVGLWFLEVLKARLNGALGNLI